MFALDNIAISSCDYPPSQFHPRTSLLSFSCNFDNSTMCDMINREASSTSAFNFTVLTGETIPNKNLGPIRDHTSTSTSGGFLYWNRDLPFTAIDSGEVITSRSIEINTGMCLKLAYYVNSTAVNKNGTTISINVAGCHSGLFWSLSLDDSQGWQTLIVPTSGPACPEKFYFGASQTVQIPVSVAFDDIEIDQCSFIIPTTTTTITTSIVTTNPPITTSVLTTPNSAHQLLCLNGYSLITIYVLSVVFRKYLF